MKYSAPYLIRSGRSYKEKVGFSFNLSFLVWDGDPVELDENNEDPITYMDAMQRSDSEKWLEAMKSEMESMMVNDVWTLVDPPKGVKSIGYK